MARTGLDIHRWREELCVEIDGGFADGHVHWFSLLCFIAFYPLARSLARLLTTTPMAYNITYTRHTYSYTKLISRVLRAYQYPFYLSPSFLVAMQEGEGLGDVYVGAGWLVM